MYFHFGFKNKTIIRVNYSYTPNSLLSGHYTFVYLTNITVIFIMAIQLFSDFGKILFKSI